MCSDRLLPKIGALAAAGVLVCACAPANRPAIERVAVIPPENLTGDAELDWIGLAVAAVLSSEAEGHGEKFVFHARSYAEAVNRRAARALHGYFSECAGGLVFHLVVEDLRRSRAVQRIERCAPAEAALEVARLAGEQLALRRRRFRTDNLKALRHYVRALSAADLDHRREALEAALREDPSFPDARILLADVLMQAGEAAAARNLAAETSGTELDEIVSARLRLLEARLSEDRNQVAQALGKLSALLPADAELAARTAQEFLSLSNFSQAAEWYGRAAEADPENPGWWNSRAYAAAYAGDSAAAFDSLERYLGADPGNANPLDSYGEICFRFGRLKEAERRFLAAYDRDPDFLGGLPLLKAAWCRVFSGDREGADELFHRYARTARDLGDRRIGLDEARWLYWTGRRGEAVRTLEQAVQQRSLSRRHLADAEVQLAVWRLLGGDAAQARNHLESAARLAGGRLVGRDAILAWNLAAGEGKGNLSRAAPEPVRLLAAAYRALFAGEGAKAAAPLRRLYETSPPLERDLTAVLLAWAEMAAGRLEEARRLLEPNPIWQPRTESAFHSLAVPGLFYLRGAVAARAGERERATHFLGLFLEYAGDGPEITGRPEAARQLIRDLSAGSR